MIDFNTFTKIAKECGRFGQINCCQKALKGCLKSHKLPNLVTLLLTWQATPYPGIGWTKTNLYFIFQPSGWRKLRSMVQWTPFVQTFKNRRYQWVQLAGHSGNFKAGMHQGTVLKKLCPQEENCYKQFHNDSLSSYVPEYHGTLVLEKDESEFKLWPFPASFNLL